MENLFDEGEKRRVFFAQSASELRPYPIDFFLGLVDSVERDGCRLAEGGVSARLLAEGGARLSDVEEVVVKLVGEAEYFASGAKRRWIDACDKGPEYEAGSEERGCFAEVHGDERLLSDRLADRKDVDRLAAEHPLGAGSHR